MEVTLGLSVFDVCTTGFDERAVALCDEDCCLLVLAGVEVCTATEVVEGTVTEEGEALVLRSVDVANEELWSLEDVIWVAI